MRSGTRESHNKLEKNRRAQMRNCFEQLKKELPKGQEEKKTSNLSILSNALNYITVSQGVALLIRIITSSSRNSCSIKFLFLAFADPQADGQGVGARAGAAGEGEDWTSRQISELKAGNGVTAGQGSCAGRSGGRRDSTFCANFRERSG